MVSFRRHIIPALWLFCVTNLAAQTVPWLTPAISTRAVSIDINCVPQVDGQFLNEGDYLGVFNNQNRCFGLVRWKDTTNMKITVFGSDGTTDGFNTGEALNMKVWLRNEDCILERISQVSADKPLVFTNAETNRVNILNFERLVVNYPEEGYCMNEGVILPGSNYNVADLTFSSATGISLDPASGVIDPLESSPGIHTIELNSGTCLARNSIRLTLKDFPRLAALKDTFMCGEEPVRIAIMDQNTSVQWSTGATTQQVELTMPETVWFRVTNNLGCSNADTFDIKKISISRLDFTVDKADCYRKGKITISNSEIENGAGPYSYILSSQLENLEFSELNDVPEGIYNIEVVNANGCVLRHAQRLIVEKDCLNDVPVFTPNDDGLDDRYFINLEGKIRIFDRNGTLKRRLTASCYFDGNDEAGHPLPMGVYMIVSDTGEKVELTIIR